MTGGTWKLGCALLAFSFAAAVHAAPATKGSKTAKAEPQFVKAKEIQWGEGPAELPKGVEFAVLHGDPTKAGQYTVRLKMPDGYKIPQHSHSRDEQLTIISGNLKLHPGGDPNAEAHELEAGDFHFLPAKMQHSAEASGETIVQINGPGPFDIHYTNAADRPNPKSARR